MLNWWFFPSEDFAVSAENFCETAMFAFTCGTLVFIGIEYAAEHWDWSWGHVRRRTWVYLVLIGFTGELLFEIGSFRYADSVQSAQGDRIEQLNTEAGTALVNAADANNEATNALGDANLASNEASNASGVADKARGEAGVAVTVARGATTAAGAAETAAADVAKQEVEIKADIAAEQAKLDSLTKEYTDFEEAITPRQLEQVAVMNAVAPYRDVPFLLMTKPLPYGDPEFAEYLATGIGLNGVIRPGFVPDDGNTLPSEIEIQFDGGNERSYAAGKALCEALADQHLDVMLRPEPRHVSVHTWPPPNIPANAVLIRIGKKQTVFFANKMLLAHGQKPIPDIEQQEQEYRSHIPAWMRSKYSYCA